MNIVTDFLDERTYKGLQEHYGDKWLKTLPSLVEDLINEHGWSFVKSLPGGRTAAVLVFETPEGLRVIKLAPDFNRSQAEFAALKIIENNGIGPKVFNLSFLEKEGAKSALISMEFIGDGKSLRQIDNNEVVSDKSLGEFLSTMINCGKQEIDFPLIPIESFILEELKHVRNPGLHGKLEVSDTEKEEAKSILEKFTRDSNIKTWVHGTLHPANLINIEGKIMVIDPRPFYGDYQYDIAELCLKWGSEKNNRRHNLADGITQLESIRQYLTVNTDAVVDWMKVLLATRV